MPFCNIVLHAQKPILKGYPVEVKTFGDHIKKRRLDLGLKQAEVAEMFGVSRTSIAFWERNVSFPNLRVMPQLTEFVGYNPYGDLLKLEAPERIATARKILGLTQEEAAKRLCVCTSKLRAWERGKKLNRLTDWKALDDFILSACRV